jgi:4-amino-4-deoxy-L-arabinose transferase-like glycosyltransferase
MACGMITTRKTIFTLAAIVILAAVFRYWQINEYPRALHLDEAISGLVAQDILRGKLPELLVYDGNEPLIFYIMAVPLYFFGPTPGALRVATESISLALVISVYLLAQELFDRKIGLLTAFICAINVWGIYHGRLATRSILVPVIISLALYFAVRAWRKGQWHYWILTGIIFGAVFYTYTSSVFVIPALLLTLIGVIIFDRRAVVQYKWKILLAAAIIVVVGLPMWMYQATHTIVSAGRPSQLTMFYAGQSASELIYTISTQGFLVARMFFIKADANIRHNIPNRPVFDVLLAIPFLIGFVSGALQKKYRGAAALCFVWLLVWLVPSFLSKDAPHFLRSSGALAFIFIFPALGLVWLRNTLLTRLNKVTSVALVAALIGGSTLITAHDYIFSGFLSSQVLYEEFFGNDSKSILELNQKLNSGWVGDNLIALPKPASPPNIEPNKLPQPYAQYLIPWLYDSDKLRQY